MSDFDEWFNLTDESRSPELKEPMRLAYEAGVAKATAGGECDRLLDRLIEAAAEIKRLRDRNQRLENAITEVSELVGQSCGVWFHSTDGGYFEKWDSLFSRFIPKFAELFDEAKKGGEQ